MTPRQEQLLKAIIEEFISTATAVGSLNIPKKYSIDASPATIRNEMAKLVKTGYLKQVHSSAGRMPTTMAFKYYLQELLGEMDGLEHTQEFLIREKLHQMRHNKASLIRNAINSLVDLTNNVAVILVDDQIYYGGLSNIVDYPDVHDMDKLKAILMMLEDYSQLNNIFSQYRGSKDIKIIIGEEIGIDNLLDFAIIFTPIRMYDNREGFISIVGPNRMKYSKIVPAIRFIANTVEEVVRGW